MQILTDSVLRAHWFRTHEKTYFISEDTRLTPAARDFIKEQGISLVTNGAEAACCTDSCSDRQTSEKPEDMTHLRGNILVPKTHPQIAFRGMLDSLEAKIMEVQIIASENSQPWLVEALDEVLAFVQQVLRAEVMDEPVAEMKLLGMDQEQIHYESQHPQEIFGISHPLPNFRMGNVCVALNGLRAFVRETELSAVRAFCEGGNCRRIDIVQALNRLSSLIYILFCRQYTGQGGKPCSRQPAPSANTGKKRFPVEASGRHVHLTREAVRVLFGQEDLTKQSDLSQPGQFVAKERVKIITAKGEFDHVAVLGPVRKEVQTELSLTDARILGIDIPVRLSGDLRGAGDVILVGPKGIYNAVGSAIASRAHIHMTPEDAAEFGVRDGDSVSVRLDTGRPVTLDEVLIRVNRDFSLAMHLDYDEANACSFRQGDTGVIVSGACIPRTETGTAQETACQANTQTATGRSRPAQAAAAASGQCGSPAPEAAGQACRRAKRCLITEEAALQLLAEAGGSGEICIAKDAIVTPLAWDTLKEHKLRVVRK